MSDFVARDFIAPDWNREQLLEHARRQLTEIQAYRATLETAALALREEADDIGLNDPRTADFLNKWADRLWKDPS